MKPADLTPSAIVIARSRARRLMVSGWCAACVVASSAATLGLAAVERHRIESLPRVDIEPISRDLDEAMRAAAAAEDELSELRARLAAADYLRERADWSALLHYIARGAAPGTIFETVECRAIGADAGSAPRALHIDLRGTAANRRDVQHLVDWLEAPILGAAVDVGRVTMGDAGRASFTIRAEVSEAATSDAGATPIADALEQ